MKKLLLFLTLLTASHIAHGAEVSEQTKDNLWYSIVDRSQCSPQNMTPQQALDACVAEDKNFSFDDFILQYSTKETNNTLLHVAIFNNDLPNVTWIVEHIDESKKFDLLDKKNKDQKTPLEIAVENKNDEITNYILHNIDDIPRNKLLSNALDAQNNALATFIITHESFNPNNSFLFNTALNKTSLLSQYINLIVTKGENGSLKDGLIQLIQSNKCNKTTLAKMLLTLLEKIYTQQNLLDDTCGQGIPKSFSTDEYEELIDAIVTNQNFDKDRTLNLFIRSNDYIWKDDLLAIEWLFNRFPEHQFADDSYINYIVGKDEDFETISSQMLALIQLLVDRKITNIPLKRYYVLEAILKNSQELSFDLNKLTINSWTPQRSFGLKAVSIAAILYDFIRFKKPEKITDVKKDIKAKITDKSGTKKDTKKADIKHDTKESKEKKELSRWKRLVKHTRNYKKDLLKNPRNHKKLAIPFACLLFRALKDKTPLKWY